MKTINKARLIVIPTVLIAIGVYFIIQKAGNSGGKTLRGSGTIEVTEINLASKIMGRIKKVNVEEGDRIQANDILVTIEGEEVNSRLDEANALYAQARENLKNVKVNLENAAKDYERYKELFKAGSIARMDLDNMETKYNGLLASYRAASAGVQKAESSIGVARFYARDVALNAPVSGTVLKRYFEPGELVMPGSIVLSCADLSNVYMKIYVPEYKLGMIKLKQKVRIKADTYKEKVYSGTVGQISQVAEFTPKNIQTEEERMRLVFAVKVFIENANDELKPGMPADAEILTD